MGKSWLWLSVLSFAALAVVLGLTFFNVSEPKVFPGIAAESNGCPTPDDAACYDCNADGEVNILDFSCFSGVYGESY